MNRVFTALLSLCILFFCCQPALSSQQSPKTFEEFIWWLPPDTETMFVARGPMTISTAQPIDFNDFLPHLLSPGVDFINKGKLLRQLSGQKLLFYVEGCRKFRSPKSLGLAPFEGCYIMTFGQEFSLRREEIVQSLEKDAKEVIKINEYKASLFETMQESDLWKFYVVSPKSDTLLIATDLNYLTETLQRLKVKGEKRALPESLPEWKQVDTTAQFWAIRHYDKSNAATDPTSPLADQRTGANAPDALATGIVAMYTPGRDFVIRYLSANADVLRIQKNFWISEDNQSTPEIRLLPSKTVEIIYSTQKQTTGALFYFLAAFGHAIYL
jgi:hypothetical protein